MPVVDSAKGLHHEVMHVRQRINHRRHSKGTDRGATIVEFALAFPVLILLIMAVLDFGVNYGNKVQTTHAAREASRSGSVGRYSYPSSFSCSPVSPTYESITGDSMAQSTAASLVCLTKYRTRVLPSYVRVKVAYMDGAGNFTTDFTFASRLANKYSIVVCVSTKTYSLTGMLKPAFNGRFIHSRSVIKTGTTPTIDFSGTNSAYQYIPPVYEAPDSGDSWTWCKDDAHL